MFVLLLGVAFALTTLGAAWTAFGPGSLIWRGALPFICAMGFAVTVGVNAGSRSHIWDVAVIVGGCLIGQWLLLQFPFWTLALGFGLRLRHINAMDQSTDGGQLRFGIRHLLIVMFVVGVVLGIGRIVVPKISVPGQLVPIYALLATTAIVVTLPLLLASLMRRQAILGILLSLVLMGLATASELPLMETLGMASAGANTAVFIAINVASALVILVVAGVVQLNGYSLYAGRAITNS